VEVRGEGQAPKTYALTQAEFAATKSSLVELEYGVYEVFPYEYGVPVPPNGRAFLRPSKDKTCTVYMKVEGMKGGELTDSTQACQFCPTKAAHWFISEDQKDHTGPSHQLAYQDAQTLILMDRAADGKAAPSAGSGAATAAVPAAGAGAAAGTIKK
jgi:hypothetical protein